MNIGTGALYVFSNHTLHISPANKNAAQSDKHKSYSRSISYDLGYQNSWYSWDGIEWRFDGSALYIRKRSGGDGTADGASSYSDYPWHHLRANIKTIDVANNVSTLGTDAFWGCYASNIYLRYNGNMNIGTSALYVFSNHTLHIWKSNKNAAQSDKNRSYTRTITYFDNTGVQCSHPAASLSGWLTSGNTHYKACSQCGNWSTSHNRLSSWKWQSNGTNHWRYCNTCGTTWDSAAHSFGSWYGNTATCTAGGVQYKKCGTCSYVTSATTTALGHSWSAEYADTDGYVKKKCTRSGCTSIQTLHGIYYTIQYDGNEATSGTTESSSHEYGKATALATNGYSRTGYTFDSWNTKADGSGTKYEDGASVINLTTSHNSTITLYAQWTVNNYPVTYIVHDITLNADLITFTHDRNYGTIVSGSEIDSELNPTAEGVFYINGDERPYKLLTENDNETLYTTAKVSTAGATIYRYCRLNEIELSFDPVVSQTDYSCDLSVKKVIPGKTYGELPTPKIKDYVFEGWYTKKSGGEQITADMIVSETQAFTVYAHWTKLPPKIISYDKEVKVIEDLGITEDEYLKQYGSLNTNFIQNGQLLYPYQTATIEVEVGGGEKTLTNSWAFQIKENDTWVLLVSYDNKTLTKDGISYKTWANKDRTKIYLGITGATRQNKNIEYKAIVTNNAGSVASGAIPLTVYWLPNIRNQ